MEDFPLAKNASFFSVFTFHVFFSFCVVDLAGKVAGFAEDVRHKEEITYNLVMMALDGSS